MNLNKSVAVNILFLFVLISCNNIVKQNRIIVWSFIYGNNNYCEIMAYDTTLIIYDDAYYGIITYKILNTDSESLNFIRVLNTTNDTAMINSAYKKFLFKNFKSTPFNHSFKKVSIYQLDNKTNFNTIYEKFVDSVIIRANINKKVKSIQEDTYILHQDDKDTLW